jgi:hypothetical protein
LNLFLNPLQDVVYTSSASLDFAKARGIAFAYIFTRAGNGRDLPSEVKLA